MSDQDQTIRVRCVHERCWTIYETTRRSFNARANRCPEKRCGSFKAQEIVEPKESA